LILSVNILSAYFFLGCLVVSVVGYPAAGASSGQLSWGLIHRGGAGNFPVPFLFTFLFARKVNL